MAALVDLPPELLSDVLGHTFHRPERLHSADHLAVQLSSHLVCRTWYQLARAAYFQTLVHQIKIRMVARFSEDPLIDYLDVMRGHPTFAAQVQNLKMTVDVQDEMQIGGAVIEATEELKRFPNLRRLHLSTSGWDIDPLTMPRLELLAKSMRQAGVITMLTLDGTSDTPF